MRARLLIGLGLVVAIACASQRRGPYFGDERYLVFGTDPAQEADALERDLERAGHPVSLRFSGQHFTALGFADAHGELSGVRVMTLRGIALALDPVQGDLLTSPVRYRLLEPPLEGTHDADGDGFEEIFVERIEATPAYRCVEVYRVRDSGFVDPVSGGVAIEGRARRDEPLWLDPFFCPEDENEPGADAGVGDGGAQGREATSDHQASAGSRPSD